MKPEYLSHCCGARIINEDICSECGEHCDEDFRYPDPEAQDIKRMAKNYPHTQVDRAEMMKIKR